MNWQDFNLTDNEVSLRSTEFDKYIYKVYNLWTHKYEGKTSKKDKANLSKQEMNSIKEKVKTIEFLERTSYERRKEYECI